MRILDLYCGQGGAGVGYRRAGFEVVGVDIDPQPRYPFEFYQADALEFLAEHGGEFDVIHASPPCQRFSRAQRLQKNAHPDLITPTRDELVGLGLPYVIENVPGSPLIDPICLCGGMFGLGTYRHRLFETSFPLVAPPHLEHVRPSTKMGRRLKPGEMMHVVGNFTGVDDAKRAMDIDWMNRTGLREAIPPAYTEYVGGQLMEYLDAEKTA